MEQVEQVTVRINSRSIKAFYEGKAKSGKLDCYGSKNGSKVFIHPIKKLDDFSTLCMIDGNMRAIVYAKSTKNCYETYYKTGKEKLVAEINGGFDKGYSSNFLNFIHISDVSIYDIEAIEAADDHMIIQFKDGCWKATRFNKFFMSTQDFTHLKVNIPEEHLKTWNANKCAIQEHVEQTRKLNLEAEELLRKTREKTNQISKLQSIFEKDWSINFNMRTR